MRLETIAIVITAVATAIMALPIVVASCKNFVISCWHVYAYVKDYCRYMWLQYVFNKNTFPKISWGKLSKKDRQELFLPFQEWRKTRKFLRKHKL